MCTFSCGRSHFQKPLQWHFSYFRSFSLILLWMANPSISNGRFWLIFSNLIFMRWNKTLAIKVKLILMVLIILFVLWYFLTSSSLEFSAMKGKVIWVNEIYLWLKKINTVKILAYSCHWNTWIFFLYLLLLWFIHSWWCSQSVVLVTFLLFWKDKLFFFEYRILCSRARQVVGVSWQVIFLQWLWFLPYFQCRFYGNL